MTSSQQTHGEKSGPGGRHTGADDVLCYTDQGSFLALRALGRGPVVHRTWIYQAAPSKAEVEAFNARLAQGPFGRLVQRSPLPWGRHRWVACTTATPVTWMPEAIPLSALPEWRARLAEFPIDPETGPGWRIAVQPLEGGGAALSLLVSHTIADGLAAIEAVVAAVSGRNAAPGFPPARPRWSPSRLARDCWQSLRALPDTGSAIAQMLRQPRIGTGHKPASHPARTAAPDSAVAVPLVQVICSETAFEARASALGVSGNTMFVGLAARIAFRMGRTGPDGRVNLVLPVSNRQPGDTRGNALTSIAVFADPADCLADLAPLRNQIKTALDTMRRDGDAFTPLFPLIPYVPKWLVRQMEQKVAARELPVGCTILGALPAELEGPCGKASLLQVSLVERYTTAALERLGGLLFMTYYRLGGRAYVTVAGYAPGRTTRREELLPLAAAALAELGIDGELS